MTHRIFRWLQTAGLFLVLFCHFSVWSADPALSQEQVRIQLKWFHQFQFAGYYAAKEKGFYASEGLDVELIERDPAVNNIDEVTQGKAQYGVADAGLLLSRLQGKPVVILAQIFQHSPLVYVTRRDSGLRTPYDLRGKNVMTESLGHADAALNAMLLKSLGSLSNVTLQKHTYRYEDLIDGRTDAMLAYATNEPFWFKEKGVLVNIIDPRDYGIDFYGDNLFTTDAELREHPERAAKIVRATLKGWKYALEHKAEIIELILNKYNSQKLSLQHLRFEAEQTETMINPRFIELGHFEPSRYQKIAEIYTQLALADRFLVDGGFYHKARKDDIGLSAEESAWLDSNPSIRVHNETDWPPFNFAKDGKPQGYSIDFMNLVASKIGLKVEYITGPTWNEFLEMMKRGELDVMLNIVKTPERQKYLLYTPPYANNPNTILSRNDKQYQSLEQLFGKTVSVPKGFFYEEILKRDYPKIIVETVDNTLASMKVVSFGTADAAFGELAVFKYLMNENLMTDLLVSGEVKLGNPEYALLNIATRKDLPILASILSKGVKSVTMAEKRALQEKWFPSKNAGQSASPEGDLKPDGSTQPILAIIALSFSLLLIFALIIFLLSRSKRGKDLSSIFGAAEFRIAILVGLSVLVAMVAVMNWLAIADSYRRTGVNTERELQIILHGSIDRLNTWINDRQAYLRQLGRDPKLLQITENLLSVERRKEALVGAPALAEARQFLASIEQFGPAGFFIIAPDRISIGSSRNANVGTQNFIAKVRPDLVDRVFLGQTIFVPPIRSDVDIGLEGGGEKKKPLTMFFAVPITDETGAVVAVLTERVLPSGPLSEILQLGKIGRTGESYAVNAEAKMVSESRFGDQLLEAGLIEAGGTSSVEIDIRDPGGNMVEGFRPAVPRDGLPMTLMMADALRLKADGTGYVNVDDSRNLTEHPSSVADYRDYRGVPVVGAWSWLHNLDLGVAVEIDYAEAFADYFEFRFNLVLISGITMLLAVGATLFTLLMGQRAHRSLSLARDHLEERVEQRTQELSEAYNIISGSINYASNIQRSMLPPEDSFVHAFKDHFLIWEPRDVVGGDIYWNTPWGGGVLVVLADCTGHGVPGAFMTLISSGALDRALENVPAGKVADLVQYMHQLVQLSLGQEGEKGESDDGLELGAVYLSSGMKHLTFVGARFSLFIVEDDEVSELKGTNRGIGYRGIPFRQAYRESTQPLRADCSYYLSTDGLIDQVGGERRRMFGKRRFKALLQEIEQLPMSEQKLRIKAALMAYQGDEVRRDDVSLIGFRI